MFGNIHYKLDDGSGAVIHVWDLAYDGNMQFPAQGEYWAATGPIVLESDGADGFVRALVADSVNKIR